MGWRNSSTDGSPTRFDARGGGDSVGKARGMISRPSRCRSIADVHGRVTPNRRPRGTSNPRPGHWRGTVWPSRRCRLHAIPQGGAWTTREGPARHQPVVRDPSVDDQQRRGQREKIGGGAINWRSGTLRKEPGSRKKIRGSSRTSAHSCSSFSGALSKASARSCFSFLEGQAFICRTTSVAITARRHALGWPVGRARLWQRQSGRDETVANPGVRIGPTRIPASSASKDVIKNVETRLLRLGMAPRFSNVMIRGSLAGVRRDGFLPDHFCDFSSWLGEAHSLTLYTLSTCEVTPKIPDKKYTTSKS